MKIPKNQIKQYGLNSLNSDDEFINKEDELTISEINNSLKDFEAGNFSSAQDVFDELKQQISNKSKIIPKHKSILLFNFVFLIKINGLKNLSISIQRLFKPLIFLQKPFVKKEYRFMFWYTK